MDRILFFTEGGKDFGFGHLTRCTGLLHGFLKKSPGIKIMFMVNGDKQAENFLETNGVKAQNINWQEKQKTVLELVSTGTLAVIDSYKADKSFYEKISKLTSGRLMMIDDYNRLDYPEGFIVNPSVYGDSLAYSRKEGVKYLLGRPYVILRKEFWEVPRKVLNRNINDILITFGGLSSSKLIKKIINNVSKKYNGNFHIVLPGKDDRSSISKNIKEKVFLYHDLSASEMRGLMLKCDICISGGGQTLYELARCGIPTIGICFADNQVGNIKSLKEGGFLEQAGHYKDDDLLEKVSGALKRLTPFESRKRRSTIGQDLIDGRGVVRITDVLAGDV